MAKTPLVIAMPEPMARALGWLKRSVGWSDLRGLADDPQGWGRYGHPEWGPFRLGKTNPTVSTAGLNATVFAFAAAVGRQTPTLVPADIADRNAWGTATASESVGPALRTCGHRVAQTRDGPPGPDPHE